MQTIADGEKVMRIAGRKAKTEFPVEDRESVRNLPSEEKGRRRGRFPGPRFPRQGGGVKFGAEMIGEKIIQFRGPRGNGNLERR